MRSPGDGPKKDAQLMSSAVEDHQDPIFGLNPAEKSDLGFIAALARSGRPRLDRILAEEVDRAAGALAVACECLL